MELDRVRAAVAGPNANRLLDIGHEDLAVADAAGAGRLRDGFHHIVDQAVLDNDLDLHLWQEVDYIFGAAVELGMALLAAKTLHLGDGYAGDAGVMKGVLHVVELERLY